MLLPLAHIPINLFIACVGTFMVLCCGGLLGVIFHLLIPPIIAKTEASKRYFQGFKNSDRWWLHSNNWFHAGGWTGTVVGAYCLFGPVWALMGFIKTL